MSKLYSDKLNNSDHLVAESSAETLSACGEAVRPSDVQARLNEPGRIAPLVTSGLI